MSQRWFLDSMKSTTLTTWKLGDRLCYEITFNDYDQVIISPGSPAKPYAKYKTVDVSLEYEIATQPDLVRCIMMKYQSMALLYERVSTALLPRDYSASTEYFPRDYSTPTGSSSAK